jgi:hypothetical protein
LAQKEISTEPSTHLRYEDIARALARYGFRARGGFHPDDNDNVSGATIILIGNAGPDMWRAFREIRKTDEALTLDTWTHRILDPLGIELGARVIYPFDGPPYAPFQRWAVLAESVFSSPIGMSLHGEYGLWHAYRGAFVFTTKIPLPTRDSLLHPCLSCTEQPCLSTCPVHAFSKNKYDVDACANQLRRAEGDDCRTLGCRARRSCPVGVRFQYEPEQAAFHMAAFLKAR